MKKVLVIVGPTAVGKTALSIQLAQKYHGEIISGDSMQIYRQLDIGTAKVTKEEMAGIPHHLIDIRAMTETYSAADFQQMGREAIETIQQQGKLPIVVGGTGLYIQALLYDFRLGAEEGDPTIRQRYEQEAAAIGKEALWQKLQAVDPLAAAKIHYNNERKVIRALEVFEMTGESIAAPKETPQVLYDFFMIGLTTERELLYQRINQRVDLMMDQGLIEEAKAVLQYPETQAAKGIGYKEFLPYFHGQATLDETIEQIKQNSRRYAKRQLTWFNNRAQPRWIDLVRQPEEQRTLETEIDQWLEEKR
ncbi:tRNA (adenosine(37)-N6)-dimethylallyltransferase MiaA [Enterococcus sp. OL5]|uniref:tRNA (adenosine(37)-N6)-dimethylallyltransferase MiaA n=1 Tax=Enterococcus sp. OL5 TaxID=2590214 RepID=UPI00112C6583|nr:tRNA (adenosine(37)-N6)-dimethylallyltransferase MiaA [Enterococcus sp. OL5]TPR55870.1 tRNA (adenosine(37)-N6)-dimethylallyltransferase MiaA [Enterococcus sp. OL5]